MDANERLSRLFRLAGVDEAIQVDSLDGFIEKVDDFKEYAGMEMIDNMPHGGTVCVLDDLSQVWFVEIRKPAIHIEQSQTIPF